MKLESIDKTGAILLMPQDEKSRRRANTAPSGKPGVTADELGQGVTIEQLQALPVPVLAYHTQITIHGQFPEVSPLCSGYKLLIRNANGSLGVKYAGIDAGKKQMVQRAMRLAPSPWSYTLDSRGLTLQIRVASIPEGRETIAAIPPGIYGSALVMRCAVSGQLYSVVNAGAICAASLWEVIGHFAPGMTEEKMRIRELEVEAEQLERESKAKAERLERAEKAKEILNTLREKLISEGAKQLPVTFNPGNGDSFRVLRLRFDGVPILAAYTLAKRGAFLYLMKEGAKGRKVEEHHLEVWRKAAQAGRVFAIATAIPSASKIPAP